MADTKPDQYAENREPAKGGLKPADSRVHPSGDTPKPEGDKLQHAVDEAAKSNKK